MSKSIMVFLGCFFALVAGLVFWHGVKKNSVFSGWYSGLLSTLVIFLMVATPIPNGTDWHIQDGQFIPLDKPEVAA